MSKPWNRNKPKRADLKRQLAYLEATRGADLICFKKGCGKKALAMDECLTCERLVAEGKRKEVHKIKSCEDHRMEGISAMKKHALVGHPANLLRVIAAGLRGDQL